jgi:tetratricopeptide (TPR) repeat protein
LVCAAAETGAAFPSARAGERAAALFRALGDERNVALSLCCLGVAQVYSGPQWAAAQAEMDSLAPETWPIRLRVWRFLAQATMHIAHGRFEEALSLAEAALDFAQSNELVSRWTFARWAIIAELALGRLDEALRRCQREIDAEHRWLGHPLEVTLGTRAEVLIRQGRCAEARLTLPEFFEASRRTGWKHFGNFGNAFAELAFHEQRHASAATLLGYARAAWGRPQSQRRSAELLAVLQAVLDSETLERLLAKGKVLDNEAIRALTLETGGGDEQPSAVHRRCLG